MSKSINDITVDDKLIKICNAVGPIRRIYDCGSRDALDGLALARSTSAKELHIFECNPPAAQQCRMNCKASGNLEFNVYMNEIAISDKDGIEKFYPIDIDRTITPHKDGNIGASSLYKANPQYPHEKYVQSEIEVKSTTLNAYSEMHGAPDILWMDLQGAELRALQGADKILESIKIIFLEVSFRPMYTGQALFWDIDKYLSRHFQLYELPLGRWPKIMWIYRLFKTGPWLANATYVNKKYLR